MPKQKKNPVAKNPAKDFILYSRKNYGNMAQLIKIKEEWIKLFTFRKYMGAKEYIETYGDKVKVYLIEHQNGKADKFAYDVKGGWHITPYRQEIHKSGLFFGEIKKYGTTGELKKYEKTPEPNKTPDYL